MSHTVRALATVTGILASAVPAFAVTFNTVPIGYPGSTPDTNLRGYLTYEYRIAKYEVTNAQYVEFLNAIAATDTYGVYNDYMDTQYESGIVRTGSPDNYHYDVKPDAVGVGPGGANYSFANKPVVYVDWYSAIRFTNWLHNGQPTGMQDATTTELGAYSIAGGTNVGGRLNGAKWFLPTENEWYKAAYYDGTADVFYDYPTASDTAPDNNFPSDDSGNSANYYDGAYTTGTGFFPLTDVGAYELSEGPNGTFDQGGNVSEWTETRVAGGLLAIGRGGSWAIDEIALSSNDNSSAALTYHVGHRGFRVATYFIIPEPTTLALGAFGLAALAVLGWRRRLGSAQ